MATTTSVLNGVCINEVGTSPDTGNALHDINGDGSTSGGGDEFVELYNTTGSPVDIGGFQLWTFDAGSSATGITHTFAPGTLIPANGFFVVIDNEGGTGVAPQNIGGADGVIANGLPLILGDNDIVVLYNPTANEYIQFNGEDIVPADQTALDAVFGPAGFNATLVGSIETGLEDNSGNSAQRLTDGDTTWVDASQNPGTTNCFARGTGIATATGERRVEDLVPGDLVCTADGRQVPVLWVGRQELETGLHPARLAPVCIRKAALGDGLPIRDLTLTTDHALALDGYLVTAGALVNGTTIRVPRDAELPRFLIVYHVETEHHELLLAHGTPTESYVDYAGRAGYDNYAEYLELYGADRLIPEMPRPRVSSARMLPEAVKTRLARQEASPMHEPGDATRVA